MSSLIKKAPYNYFYMLDSDSDDETAAQATPEPSAPPQEVVVATSKEEKTTEQHRVWDTNDTSRFKKDNTNVFSSPFSRKKTKWSKEETNEWTRLKPEEIQVGTTHSLETKQREITPDTTSLEWAERIKDTFERHESKRMSFFKT
jgi:hypothetical protein